MDQSDKTPTVPAGGADAAQQQPADGAQAAAAAARGRFRQLDAHRVGDADRIRIESRDDAAGAYRIAGFDGGPSVDLQFQQGDAAEVGTNGVTPLQLIAVAADRLRQQQEQQTKQAADAGDKPDRAADKSSAAALKHLEAAISALQDDGAREAQDRARTRREQGAGATAAAGARAAAAAAPTTPAAPAPGAARAAAAAPAPAAARR